MSMRSLTRLGLGLGLLVVGALGLDWPLAWIHRAHVEGYRALRHVAAAGCSRPLHGAVGVLDIPSLDVVAPVAQGLDDTTLSWAVGHDPASPWPGQRGTAVLAAHDVSYFASNASLRPGAIVIYEQACHTYIFAVRRVLILHPGELIPEAGPRSLALDSCWPANALFLTPDRLIVTAALIASSRGRPLNVPLEQPAPGLPAGVPTPPNLFASGWLAGVLSIQGAPALDWRDSSAPLAWEAASLATLSAAREGHATHATWAHKLLAASVRNPGALEAPYVPATPVDVTEVVVGERVAEVTITATLGTQRTSITEVPDGASLKVIAANPLGS